MNTYDDSGKLKDALQIYFSKYHFADGGYNDKWFKIKLGPIFLPFPNTRGRIAAVKIHDIHHIITEYEADIKGEAEIAGWEIASGCGNYYAAWTLNFGSFFYGLLFFPRPLFRAFMKGRRVRTNFYYDTTYDEILLNRSVGELRDMVRSNKDNKILVKDYLQFAFYCAGLLSGGFVFLFLVFQVVCR